MMPDGHLLCVLQLRDCCSATCSIPKSQLSVAKWVKYAVGLFFLCFFLLSNIHGCTLHDNTCKKFSNCSSAYVSSCSATCLHYNPPLRLILVAFAFFPHCCLLPPETGGSFYFPGDLKVFRGDAGCRCRMSGQAISPFHGFATEIPPFRHAIKSHTAECQENKGTITESKVFSPFGLHYNWHTCLVRPRPLASPHNAWAFILARTTGYIVFHIQCVWVFFPPSKKSPWVTKAGLSLTVSYINIKQRKVGAGWQPEVYLSTLHGIRNNTVACCPNCLKFCLCIRYIYIVKASSCSAVSQYVLMTSIPNF